MAAVLTTGQLMEQEKKLELRRKAEAYPTLQVLEHLPDLPSYMAAADLVVAMEGYNTSAEILTTQTPAIIVPRTWRSGERNLREEASIRVDGEQALRAQAFSQIGLASTLNAKRLTPSSLAKAIEAELSKPQFRRGCLEPEWRRGSRSNHSLARRRSGK